MVSIIPAERSSWDVIGKSIGKNLSENLPGAVQRGYERQLGVNAVDQAQKDIIAANGDPMQMAIALSKAAIANPEAARALGPLYQTALTQGQRKRGVEDFPPGKSKVPVKPGDQPGQEVPVSVSDLVKPRESSVRNPQGVTDFQLPYGPEEFAQMRQKSRELGYLPEMEDRYAKDMEEYNNIAQTRRNVELSNYQQQQQQLQDTLANQRLFTNYMKNNAKELWENPDDREMSLKASERILNDPKNKNTSFADLLSKVKNEIRPYQAAREALRKTLSRPLFGQTKEQRDLSRRRAKFMVENGQKPQLQLMIAQGGNGEAEEADLLNPLPSNIEDSLQKGFPKFITPLEEVKDIDPESSNFEKELNFGREKRQKQEQRMVDYLSDTIVPGTYDYPGTNLILVRKNLMDKNLGWEDSAKVIDQSIINGKIKLDPQQNIDYQKLAYPPLTGDTYMDTVLNNILFPITGRQ